MLPAVTLLVYSNPMCAQVGSDELLTYVRVTGKHCLSALKICIFKIKKRHYNKRSQATKGSRLSSFASF